MVCSGGTVYLFAVQGAQERGELLFLGAQTKRLLRHKGEGHALLSYDGLSPFSGEWKQRCEMVTGDQRHLGLEAPWVC